MVKKLKAMADKQAAGNNSLAGTVKDSAQQIWLAGLGAYSKAQEEGGKVFEALVKEGMAIQKRTQAAAEEKVSEATSKMSAMAENITARAGQQWDKLETIFEDRVSKAINKLGVPSAKDIETLTKRIEELNKSVQKLAAEKSSASAAGANSAAKPAAKRSSARKSAPAA
jgi:poly(hydroxyalkanoate) granule-associated protein